MIRVEPFSGSAAEWDAFVRDQPGWTHFHLLGWRDVVERAFGHQCLYWAARAEDGSLSGVLPLVRVRSRLFGHYLVSMPYVNYGGPLGGAPAVQALVARSREQAAMDGVGLLELRSRARLDVTLPASHRKVTVVLPLPAGDAGPLWDGFKPKLRSQVRRPQKEGVTVRFGTDQIEPFFRVFASHMRDLGTPTHARVFFEIMADRFPDSVRVGCAWLNGRPIAGGMGFVWNGEFEMTWASSLRAFNAMAPNMLVYWSFMEQAVAGGLKRFNFGRCTPGSGTHRFKQQWGGEDEPLWWYHAGRAGADHTPSPDDGRWAWGPRVWRRLPLPLATFLGPRIVRSIP